MKNTLKTLLITSALAFSLSACNHMHAKHQHDASVPCMKDGKCMLSQKMDKMSDRMEAASRDLQSLNKDLTDPVAKERALKIKAEMGAMSTELKDMQKNLDAMMPKKAVKKKAATAAAKPATAPAQPATAPAAPKK